MDSSLNFSLTQLEYVLAVQKYGHFAKAAKACFVTQPTLSMQLQKLETVLGVVIFDRSKKPILLTDAGKKLVEQMQAIVFEARKLNAIIHQGSTGTVKGELTLGIIPTLAPYILPRLLPTIESLYPDLNLRIFEMQTHRIIDALNDDEIDVGLLATPLKAPHIEERPLFWEPFSLLCRKGDPLAKRKRVNYENINSNEIWLLEEGHCLRHQVLDVCSAKGKKNQNRRFQFESGSLETLKRLVASYGGYTLLPALATDDLGSKSVLVSFERPIPGREIGLVTRRKQYKSELIEALATATLECIPSALRDLNPKNLDVLPVG